MSEHQSRTDAPRTEFPPPRNLREPWSASELSTLRRFYPQGGVIACRPHLPDRNDNAIYVRAAKLGIKAPRQRSYERWITTPHIDEAIRRAYADDTSKGMAARLAKRIGRPQHWVWLRAQQLGVAPPRYPDPPWSPAEVEILQRNAAKSPRAISATLARNGFKRSAHGVALKMLRLRCDRSDDDHYTAHDLAELMGVGGDKVRRWIDRGWLKASRHSEIAGSLYRIHWRDVRRFVIANVGAIDLRRVEKHWFVELLTRGRD